MRKRKKNVNILGSFSNWIWQSMEHTALWNIQPCGTYSPVEHTALLARKKVYLAKCCEGQLIESLLYPVKPLQQEALHADTLGSGTKRLS